MTDNKEIKGLNGTAKSAIYNFDGYHIYQRNDTIIQLNFDKGFYGEIEDAQNIVEHIIKLSNGKKFPILVIYQEDNQFSKETREYIAAHKHTLADGLVINGLALKILANAYMVVNKPVRPTHFFNNEKSAVEWLRNFL